MNFAKPVSAHIFEEFQYIGRQIIHSFRAGNRLH